MILGGRHVGIPVTAMKAMRAFYEGLLGFNVKSIESEEGPFIETILGIPKVRVHVVKLIAADGWMVELLEYVNPPSKAIPQRNINSVGHAHIALTVADVETEYRRLEAAGINFLSSPQVSPNGAAKVVFCKDPEGNYVELVQVLAGTTLSSFKDK